MGVRCEVDSGKERLAKQIRNAEMQRVPVMAVVGDKEVASGELAVRARPGPPQQPASPSRSIFSR